MFPDDKTQSFMYGVLGALVVFVLASAVVFVNRAAVFDYFASQYLAERQERLAENDNTVSRNVLTEESLIVDIVEEANPAVVSVVVTKEVPVVEEFFEEFSPFGGPFSIRIPRLREGEPRERRVGSGSGFLVSSDGLIITNRHVVSDEEATYSVFTNDGEQLEATVLARDPFFDLAVLQIEEGGDFEHLALGNSDTLRLGQTVIAIGNALGEFRNSVSVGVVSGLSRTIVAGDRSGNTDVLEEVIQTDAAVNPGNSGGPLLDLSGRVVGINVAVARGSENIAFSLPANLLRGVIESVEQYGEIVRPFLGVRYVMLTEAIAQERGLKITQGALVFPEEDVEGATVIPDSPADTAGVQPGDIIISIDGERLTQTHSLASAIRDKAVGDIVTLIVLRDGEEHTLTATLKKAPEDL